MIRHRCWKVLLIDDDEDDYVMTRALLQQACGNQFELSWANDYESGWKALMANTYDAVLVDYNLGFHNGLELVRRANAEKITAPFILVTGYGGYDLDVEAMKAGAADYLGKSELNAILLERVIRYAIERKREDEKYDASVKEMEYLAQSAIQFLNLQAGEDIFALIADLLYRLVQPDRVIISEFDAINRQTTVRAIRCSEAELNLIDQMIGQPLVGLTLQFTDETRDKMRQGKLVEVSGGLYELSFHQLPWEVCQAFEQQLQIGNIFAIPFAYETDLLGTVAVLTHGKEIPESSRAVEALVSQAGIALKRRQAEETLLKALKRS